jgi:hypothetical protein
VRVGLVILKGTVPGTISVTMPNIREKWDSKLIDLFLSVYDGGTWAGSLSATDRPESRVDRAVEVVATRKSDGLQLAIEHTLIEPFVGDKSDYHGHFKSVQQRLRADASLRLPGFALFLDLPVGALPRKSDWQSIADEIGAWLRTEHASFTDRIGERPCPCLHHPSLELMVQVRKMPLGDRARSFPVIVARYGDPHLDESVDKALRNKLSKLVEDSRRSPPLAARAR